MYRSALSQRALPRNSNCSRVAIPSRTTLQSWAARSSFWALLIAIGEYPSRSASRPRGEQLDLTDVERPLIDIAVRKRTEWVRWGQPRARAVVAGTTALSEASMVTDEDTPTYALRDRDVAAALSKGEMFVLEGREEAEARLEAWKYDPWLLAENGRADRCSLYLSLRNSADERVQKEIQFLIEGLPQ